MSRIVRRVAGRRQPFRPAQRRRSNFFSPSIICVQRLAADGRLDDVVHVGDTECPSVPHRSRSIGHSRFDCPLMRKTPAFSHARHRWSMASLTLSASFSSSSRSGPKILIEFSPFTPESASMTLSRMICEKSQSTPGKCRVQLVVHFVDQFRLGARPALRPGGDRPFVHRLAAARRSRCCSSRSDRCRRPAGRSAARSTRLRDTCGARRAPRAHRSATSSSDMLTGKVPRTRGCLLPVRA